MSATYLRQLRDREHARKLSRTWAAAQSGRSALPSQMFRGREGGTGQPTIGTQVPDAGPAGAADPYAVTVTTGTQSFASTGTLASFTGEPAGPVTVGFSLTFPTTVLTVVKPGTYRLDLNHTWATYQGGGSLSVLVNGETVWGPDSATSSAVFQETVNLGLLQRDDEVTVSIAPTAGTESGTCIASLVLVEPAAPVAIETILDPTLIGTTDGNGSSTESFTLNVSVPTGLEEGDVLVASFISHSGTTGPHGPQTIPAGWTTITTWVDSYDNALAWCGWRRADATDVAGTSYAWTAVSGGSVDIVFSTVMITAHRAGFAASGNPFGAVSENQGDAAVNTVSPSFSEPNFFIALAVRAANTSGSDEAVSVDAPATVLASLNTGATTLTRNGRHVHGFTTPGSDLVVNHGTSLTHGWRLIAERA